MSGENQTEENVAADAYFAIAEAIDTKQGYSVLEHVEAMKSLLWDARAALGRLGANGDTKHPQRKLWERISACLDGRLEDT